jgi:hypothetical protein
MSNWNNIAHTMSNVFRFIRTEVATNPASKIFILIRNDKTGDQFEASDVPHSDMPGFLRRAADKIENDAKRGSEALKGTAMYPKTGDAETVVLEDKSRKTH